MAYVTTITLRSGDRATLESVVADIRRTADRKGIYFKGPHTAPPERIRVPQYNRITSTQNHELPSWDYTVYERVIRLSGHDDAVRQVATWDFPPEVHVEINVDHVRSAGTR